MFVFLTAVVSALAGETCDSSHSSSKVTPRSGWDNSAGRADNSLRAAEAIDNRDVGVLLRISKQYGDLIPTIKPKEAAEQVAKKAFSYAQRAVEIDPKVAKSHLILGQSPTVD